MSEYQLQIKQVVDYPRCRIYRQFVQSLMADRSIRIGGGSGLFYFTVLCSYANFRTSYRRIDGISYTIYPGEWICTIKELADWFRTHFQRQALDILDELQKRNLISYLSLDRGKVVKYRIRDWKNHNTVLDYNCPCQKDTGFFFMPVTTAMELVGAGRCSELDIILDLWLSTIYNDGQVLGSEVGPVVYLRNGTGCPLVNYNELAARWGISKATVGRVLKKFEKLDYISLIAFPGTKGSVIYLRNYLSTMFQISDVLIDKEEVAMVLNIKISLSDEDGVKEEGVTLEPDICVSEELSSVSKSHMESIVRKMAEILDSQGVSCFRCQKARYKLYPLSDDWEGKYLCRPREALDKRIGMDVHCGNDKQVYTFELTLSPTGGMEKED
ncbi:MAG: MarR family transcriptional regulator [Acetatifactor sp.]|nr:MarR family transcriptional regulator [Acetatifactor sp.]